MKETVGRCYQSAPTEERQSLSLLRRQLPLHKGAFGARGEREAIFHFIVSYGIMTAEMVHLQGLPYWYRDGDEMKLNQAISQRLSELLEEKKMTQYQLYTKSGVPKSTIGNVINCSYDSVKLRVIHEMCQGLEIDIPEFFNSSLFAENNLDP